MVSLGALVVPMVLAAVLVFVVSSVLHMVLNWHKNDYRGLSNEGAVADALRGAVAGPGIYNLPHCGDMKEMGTPEVQAKFAKGPVAMIVVMPNGPMQIGKFLGLWFVYSLLVSLFCAYVAAHSLAADAHYLAVFRIVGSVAFVAYALSNMVDSIWRGFPWSVTAKHMADGLLYALVTAGAFGWLWPR